MRQQKLITARKVFFALALAGLLASAAATLCAQSNDESTDAAQSGIFGVLGQWRQAQAQQLEGSWTVTVTPVVPPGVPQPPSFQAYSTFARGGGSFGSDRTRPFSKQHGTWVHLGGNRFASTFKEDLFDAMGNFEGILTVRVRTTLTGRDTFVGVANGERRDANGNLVFSGCTTIKGTRIKVEPLSAQCQNITPPQ